MSDNLVVVAIPSDDDPVWKVSSEKIPHLTLLFLGDSNPNVEEIMLFVQHAVDISEHGSFMLSVDHRSTLGEDKADVIFFEKNHSFKWINQFRSQLLQNGSIREAYESTDQFPVWQPHLTLGYPASPAKEDDSNLHWVTFDRIAVWTGDYEGPEFRLKWPERELEEVTMSDVREIGEEFVEHYGAKGMKWGVRQTETKKGMFDPEGQDKISDVAKAVIWPLVPPLGIFAIPAYTRLAVGGVRGAKAKRVDTQEKRFEKNAHSGKNFVEIHNGAANRVNREINGINKKYSQDLTKDPVAQKKYDAEVTTMMQKAYRESANQLGNKTGTRHLDVEFKNDGLDFKIVAKEGMQTPTLDRVKHAAEEDTVEFTGKIKRNATGHIIGFEFDDFKPQPMIHTINLGAQFVEHFGTKGMKWGVRNTPPPMAVSATARSIVPHGTRQKTKVKTEGGEHHDASDDAIKVAKATVKLKKSGPKALTNAELREVANRIRLEQEVKILTSSSGRKFVNKLFKDQSGQAANQAVGAQIKRKFPKAF